MCVCGFFSFFFFPPSKKGMSFKKFVYLGLLFTLDIWWKHLIKALPLLKLYSALEILSNWTCHSASAKCPSTHSTEMLFSSLFTKWSLPLENTAIFLKWVTFLHLFYNTSIFSMTIFPFIDTSFTHWMHYAQLKNIMKQLENKT